MDEPNEREAFMARCRRVADAARNAGLELQKAAAGRRAIEISREGRIVEFRIVSDERVWRVTTVEEAFYAVLLDARGAICVNLDAVEMLDEAERAVLPVIEREILARRARSAQLAELVGGQARLDALLDHVDASAL